MSKDRYSDSHTIEILQDNDFLVSAAQDSSIRIYYDGVTEYIEADSAGNINLYSAGATSVYSEAQLSLTGDLLTTLTGEGVEIDGTAGYVTISSVGGDINLNLDSSDANKVLVDGRMKILTETSDKIPLIIRHDNPLADQLMLSIKDEGDVKFSVDAEGDVECGDITCDTINIAEGGGNSAIDWSDVSPETDINLQPVGNDILLETDDGAISLKAHEKVLYLNSYNSGIKLNQDSSSGEIEILSEGIVEIVAVNTAGLYCKESRYSGERSKVWCKGEYAAIQGAIQSSNNDSGLSQDGAVIYVGREGYPRVLVETDFEGDSDGADKWVMSINNYSSYDNTYTGGEKYILRLAMNETSPSSNDNDPDHDGLSGWSDYYLRCVNSISSATDVAGSVAYYIDANGNTPDSLTGQHWVVYEASGEEDRLNSNLYGMIAISSGKIFNTPKLDEALPVVKICRSTKDSRVYGVLTKSWRGYDMRQFLEFDKPYNEVSRGEVAPEKDESSYSINSLYYKARVNSVGEGQVWITNYGGEILNGDYITSSEITGYGMRQDDDILHSYTVAKCVETIDWNSVTDVIEHDGEEYKRYLSACTYHCG